jgi:hypothetical protein
MDLKATSLADLATKAAANRFEKDDTGQNKLDFPTRKVSLSVSLEGWHSRALLHPNCAAYHAPGQFVFLPVPGIDLNRPMQLRLAPVPAGHPRKSTLPS